MKTKARSTESLDRTRHAAPQVFDRLRDLIISLELPPGAVLSRDELAKRFSVSQTPVRDALMRLAEEGLVDIFPQHATVVSAIRLGAAQQAHFLRRGVELEIVRALADKKDAMLAARLKASLAEQKALAVAGDHAAFTLADQAFHRTMYEAAGVPDLFDLVRRLSGHLDRLRRLHLPTAGKIEAILRDHTAIQRAIAHGDSDAAAAALAKHLSGTLSQVEVIRAKHPDYVRP